MFTLDIFKFQKCKVYPGNVAVLTGSLCGLRLITSCSCLLATLGISKWSSTMDNRALEVVELSLKLPPLV